MSTQALHLQIFFEALSRKAPKVIDWLRQYDADGSGVRRDPAVQRSTPMRVPSTLLTVCAAVASHEIGDISKKEFKKAVKEVGMDNGLVDIGFVFGTRAAHGQE